MHSIIHNCPKSTSCRWLWKSWGRCPFCLTSEFWDEWAHTLLSVLRSCGPTPISIGSGKGMFIDFHQAFQKSFLCVIRLQYLVSYCLTVADTIITAEKTVIWLFCRERAAVENYWWKFQLRWCSSSLTITTLTTPNLPRSIHCCCSLLTRYSVILTPLHNPGLGVQILSQIWRMCHYVTMQWWILTDWVKLLVKMSGG